jgi:hypothetical protein
MVPQYCQTQSFFNSLFAFGEGILPPLFQDRRPRSETPLAPVATHRYDFTVERFDAGLRRWLCTLFGRTTSGGKFSPLFMRP